MNKVISIFAVSLLLSGICHAEETRENASATKPSEVCVYEGKQYTPGSVVEMEGLKRECRDGQNEFIETREKRYMKAKEQGREIYISPSAYPKELAWRPVVESDS